MKRGIWILVFLLLVSIVSAQVNIDIEGDKSPGAENTIKVMVDDPGWFKEYVNSILTVEVIGPARFSDGNRTKVKEIGNLEEEADVFEDTIQINKGHAEDKGRVIIIATFEYNLKKGVFKKVIEVDRTTKTDIQIMKIEGFQIVKDTGDFEALLDQKAKLESEKKSLEQDITNLKEEISNKDEIIKEQEGIIKGLQDENTSLKIESAIKKVIYVGIGLLSLTVVILFILYRKVKKKYHHSSHHKFQ